MMAFHPVLFYYTKCQFLSFVLLLYSNNALSIFLILQRVIGIHRFDKIRTLIIIYYKYYMHT